MVTRVDIRKNKRTSKSYMRLMASVIVATLLALAVHLLWDGYLNGSEYRSVVKQCGTERIIYGYSNPKDPTLHYVRPTDPDYSPPFPSAHYFCTEQQAQDAGYTPLTILMAPTHDYSVFVGLSAKGVLQIVYAISKVG